MSGQEPEDVTKFDCSLLDDHAAGGKLKLGQEWESDAQKNIKPRICGGSVNPERNGSQSLRVGLECGYCPVKESWVESDDGKRAELT